MSQNTEFFPCPRCLRYLFAINNSELIIFDFPPSELKEGMTFNLDDVTVFKMHGIEYDDVVTCDAIKAAHERHKEECGK